MIKWVHHTEKPLYLALETYVSSKIWGEHRPFFYGTIMAVIEGDALQGAAIFHNYDKDAGVIEVSAAAETPRWLTRRVLKDMFGYPFDQLGCQAVIMRVDPDNRRLDRILKAYGFERHDIPRLRGRDKAEALFILTDDVWRANGFHKEQRNG